MPVLSLEDHVDGPPRLVAGVLRETGPAATALARAGARLEAPARLLVAGDEERADRAGDQQHARPRGVARRGAARGPPAPLRRQRAARARLRVDRPVDCLLYTSPSPRDS